MSWDISLKQEVYEVGNYTSNVARMYNKAIGKSMRDFEGMVAEDALSLLQDCYYEMTSDPEAYKELNPENGWGNYDGAVAYLKKLIDGCKEFPTAVIEVL